MPGRRRTVRAGDARTSMDDKRGPAGVNNRKHNLGSTAGDGTSARAFGGTRPVRAVGWALAAGITLSVTVPAAAQNAPTREEILRAPALPQGEETPVAIDGDDEIERSPCPLADPQFANLRFTLSRVQFDNADGIDISSLDPSWRGLTGQSLPLSTICDIRDHAGTILRRDGYLAAVQVPVQTIEDGVVRLTVLAASLSGLQVRGDAGPSARQLQAYLAPLQDQQLFNVRQAERYLLLANSIPGLSARLTLRPAGTPGQVVGEIIVDRTPAFVDANIQNFGSKAVGRISGIARLRLNGLTGLGDQTTLAVYSTAQTREQQVVQGGHEFRLGSEGLTLATDLTYAWTRPTLGGGLDIDTETLIWTTQARYPLVLRQARTLWASAGLDWIDQDVNAVGALLSRDKLRVAWAGIDARWIDPASFAGGTGYSPAEPRWSARVSGQIRQGLGFLGASDPCSLAGASCFGPGAVPISRIEADPSAFVVRADAEFAWRPHPMATIVVAPHAQYSRRPLLSYEEFSAGNFTVGRGYDPGTLTGDRGVAVTSELRLGSAVPRSNNDLAIQPFGFFDAAWVWNRDSIFAGLNPQRLYSAGGGVRAMYGNRFSVDLSIAEPLRSAGLIPVRPATRFLFSITTQFGLGR